MKRIMCFKHGDVQVYGIPHFGAFVAAIILLLIIPGPGNLSLIAATSRGGLKAGFAAMGGILLGGQALMWLALAGLAAMLQSSPAVFQAVQLAGAGYLAFLGLSMLSTRATDKASETTSGNFFRETLLVSLLNPKTVVFYMAFLQVFIDPSYPAGTSTFVIMSATVALLAFTYCTSVVLITHYSAGYIRSRKGLVQMLRRAAGCVMLGFSLRLFIGR